jgi:hypothetical protein
MGIHRLGSVTWPGGVVTAELFSDGSDNFCEIGDS